MDWTGTAPTAPDGGQQNLVPSGRLKEEADKRRAAEQRAAQAEEQNRRLTDYLGKIYQQQQTQAKPAAPTDGPVDPTDAFLDDTFGKDDAGQKARRAVALMMDKQLKERGYVTQEQAAQMVQQAVSGVSGRWQSSVNVANQLQELHRNGQINDEGLSEMQQEVTRRVSQPGMEAVMNNPVQMRYVVDSVIADGLRAGKINPIQPRSTNPLQPGNGHAPTDAPPKFNPAESPFPSLRTMKAEDSERLYQESARRNQGVR